MKGFSIMTNKKTKKHSFKFLSVICIMLVASLCFMLTGCGGEVSTTSTSSKAEEVTSEDTTELTTEDTTETPTFGDEPIIAEIDIKNYGKITVELDGKTAPITVANFINLANEGFYDGLTFHRIIKGFMMQGGDPLGNGTGGSDEDIVGEFALNGHTNNISHIRGTISMARSGSSYEQYLSMGYKMSDLPADAKSDIERACNSGSSQFFICHKDSTFLDGSYAAFGRVTEGMEVVDAVCEQAKPTDDNGTIPKSDQPVIESIKILE